MAMSTQVMLRRECMDSTLPTLIDLSPTGSQTEGRSAKTIAWGASQIGGRRPLNQ